MKRKPIPAAQWWRNAEGTFRVVSEYLGMAKRAELRDEGHDCGHTFRIQVAGRGHSWGVVGDNPPRHSDADWWHDDGTVEVRAHNLRDAKRQLALQPPDIVLLDLQLPDGSGMDLFDEPRLPEGVLTYVGFPISALFFGPLGFFGPRLALLVFKAACAGAARWAS